MGAKIMTGDWTLFGGQIVDKQTISFPIQAQMTVLSQFQTSSKDTERIFISSTRFFF